ncbi:hypothetical protein [Pseudoxanthomonas suwonensis]
MRRHAGQHLQRRRDLHRPDRRLLVQRDRPARRGQQLRRRPQYYVQYLGLRDSHDELGLGSSAGSVQYGGGGGGVVQEAMYRIFARSHDPANNSERAVVVLQANVVAK